MFSDKFRYQLRHEAELWQAEGLINESQYEQLAARYQFRTLDMAARDRFVAILIGLGSILIGLGIITFVAANWQELPRAVKVTVLLSLFVGVNIAGFYLWRRSPGRQHRLGEGLLLLGALILGANMGLMGQMFHIHAPFYELLMAWGVGVLAMAYSLRLPSLGVLSMILIISGYWNAWTELAWQRQLISSLAEFSWSSQIVLHMPLFVSLVFIPLAYWCRSRWIFTLAATMIVLSIEVSLGFLPKSANWWLAIAFALPPALLWGYDDSWVYGDWLWQFQRHQLRSSATVESFQPIARNLAILNLSILFYLSSLYWFWNSLSTPTPGEPSEFSWIPLVDILILSAWVMFRWGRLAWLARKKRALWRENLPEVAIAIFIGLTTLVPLVYVSVAPNPWLATLTFNAMLFLLAAGLIQVGLAQGQRFAFWGGMMLLTLRIFTWFVHAAGALLFNSVVFILAGIGAILVGLWFERHIRTLNHTPEKRVKKQE